MDLENSPGPEETAVAMRFQEMEEHWHRNRGVFNFESIPGPILEVDGELQSRWCQAYWRTT